MLNDLRQHTIDSPAKDTVSTFFVISYFMHRQSSHTLCISTRLSCSSSGVYLIVKGELLFHTLPTYNIHTFTLNPLSFFFFFKKNLKTILNTYMMCIKGVRDYQNFFVKLYQSSKGKLKFKTLSLIDYSIIAIIN